MLRTTATSALALLMATAICACATTHGHVTETEAVSEVNIQDGAALKGYDPVGYFVDGMPEAGNPAISYEWQGAKWLFSSTAHRDAFKADPARFAPQFGGYCAYAVSVGTTADGDPQQWAVVGDRLYVNNNPKAKALWDADRSKNITAGEANWPLIPKRPVGSSEVSAP
jgi:YHS domain-containing protein